MENVPFQGASRCIASALLVDGVWVVDGEVNAVGWGGVVDVDGGERSDVEVESIGNYGGGYKGGDGVWKMHYHEVSVCAGERSTEREGGYESWRGCGCVVVDGGTLAGYCMVFEC